MNINKQSHTLICRFGRIKGGFQAGQLNTVDSTTLGLNIPIGWPDAGPKILHTQAVQLFNSRGTVASIQKKGRDVQANQVKANKAVIEALNTVVLWVAKLPLVANLLAALVSPDPVAQVSPTPEVEAIRRRRGPKQGIKRRRTQVDAEDLLQV